MSSMRGQPFWKVPCVEIDSGAVPTSAPVAFLDSAAASGGSGPHGRISANATFLGLDLAGELRVADPQQTCGVLQSTFLLILRQHPIQFSVSSIHTFASFSRNTTFRIRTSSDLAVSRTANAAATGRPHKAETFQSILHPAMDRDVRSTGDLATVPIGAAFAQAHHRPGLDSVETARKWPGKLAFAEHAVKRHPASELHRKSQHR
jgi:hypothetical protein